MALFSLGDAAKALTYRLNPTALVSIFLVNTYHLLLFYLYYYRSYFKDALDQTSQDLFKRCLLWSEITLILVTIVIALIMYAMACMRPSTEDSPTRSWRPLRVMLIASIAFEIFSQLMFLIWYGFGHLSSYRPCFHWVAFFGIDVCVLAGFHSYDQPELILAKLFAPWLKG